MTVAEIAALIESGDVDTLMAELSREDERRSLDPTIDPTQHQRLNMAITMARHKRASLATGKRCMACNRTRAQHPARDCNVFRTNTRPLFEEV